MCYHKGTEDPAGRPFLGMQGVQGGGDGRPLRPEEEAGDEKRLF